MYTVADPDLIAVTARLRSSLDDARGKLRARDALRLAGLECRTQVRMEVVTKAMRQLGWDHGRYRFNGALESAYRRGGSLERDVVLDVDRADDGQLVVMRRELP